MKWITTFKNWLTSPSVKTWLKNAFLVVKKIVGSPEAKQLYIDLIAASLGSTPAQVRVIWDILERLATAADAAFPEPKSGDQKYAMVATAFKATPEGSAVSTLDMDVVLHNILLQHAAQKTMAAARLKS
jgi:hypothetical protein